MNKKIIIGLILTLTALAVGCAVKKGGVNIYNENTLKTPNSNESTTNCVDCGESGWQKMAEKCDSMILNKNDFKKCLMKFPWSSVNAATDVDEIEEGYIEIGSMETLKDPTTNAFRVYIYHQWAVDENGTLYLLGQLG